MCSGIPSASATCVCPYETGLEMIASARKGVASGSSGSGAVAAGHVESQISFSMVNFSGMSPAWSLISSMSSRFGISFPCVLTMNPDSFTGSPPRG